MKVRKKKEKVLLEVNFFKKEIKIFIKNIPVFEPYSSLILAWDILIILIILFSFFWLPLKISFAISNIS